MYAIVSKSGEVLKAPVNLISRYKDVRAFHTLSDEQRKEHGWYPCTVLNENYNPRLFSRNPPVYDFDGERVTVTHQNIPKSLEQVKAETLKLINEERNSFETQGFLYLGYIFQSDERSVARIQGAVAAAQAAMVTGNALNLTWMTADNQPVEMDIAKILGMVVALAEHTNNLHQYARALKTQIEACETPEEVIAVDIYSDWPVPSVEQPEEGIVEEQPSE